MMKIRIPILVQDPSFWQAKEDNELPPVEEVEFVYPVFKDGPETDLVKISDELQVVFEKRKGRIHGYRGKSERDMYSELRELMKANDRKKIMEVLDSDEFILVSTFACVLRTMSLFERSNALGRPIQWKFSPAPLICEPRLAGVGTDARYERPKTRIYFGVSPDPSSENRLIYLSLSREAVAHETAHAIIDGINPHLYENGNPHAGALHESLADLTALLVAIKSKPLMSYVLKRSGGSLDGENAFSEFAENIGVLLNGGKAGALRSFANAETLSDPIGDVYQASMVLSGAIWDIFRRLHARYRDQLVKTQYKDASDPKYSASGGPLVDIARRIRTLLYRALDYLPGGEITLADYGRALILVDRIQFGRDTKIAQILEEVFQQRKIFKDRLAAKVDDDTGNYPPLPQGGWAAMVDSEQVLQNFIENSRAWLGIPSELEFDKLTIEIQPLITPPSQKSTFIEVTEFRKDPTAVLRLLWNEQVHNIQGGKLAALAPNRSKLIGTTVIIDCVRNSIVGRLSNATPTKELYPDPDIRVARENSVAANNHETGLFLENCKLKRVGMDEEPGQPIGPAGQVVQDTLLLSGPGLSIHEGEFPTILILTS